MKLSIVIPVYNERDTILKVLERVRQVDLPKEMIVVDDFSERRSFEKGVFGGIGRYRGNPGCRPRI